MIQKQPSAKSEDAGDKMDREVNIAQDVRKRLGIKPFSDENGKRSIQSQIRALSRKRQ
jgi:hypothetical protein